MRLILSLSPLCSSVSEVVLVEMVEILDGRLGKHSVEVCNKLFITLSNDPRAQASRVIGKRSEPLSRVFNEQPCGIYIVESVRTYVSNKHTHVRMSH